MISPAFLFSTVWIFTLLLYMLKFTNNIVEMNKTGLLMIIGNIVLVTVLQKKLVIAPTRFSYEGLVIHLDKVKSFARVLLFVWLIGTIAEIIYCDGFPLLWRVNGDPRLYVHFGIPSLHGILNACYLQLCTLLMVLYLTTKEKKYLYVIVVLLIWPVLMIGRGILLSAIIQVMAVMCIFKIINFRHALRIALAVITFILLFGFLGNFRSDSGFSLGYIVNERSSWLFDNLPTGFLWIYLYITAGLSNLFYNLDTLTPSYRLDYSISNLIPSFLKNTFGLNSVNDKIKLVDPMLNTSTAYSGFVADFGAIGGFLGMSVVLITALIIYKKSLKLNVWSIASYAVIVQILIFSVFYDMFFLLPTLFQFFLALLLMLFIERPWKKLN